MRMKLVNGQSVAMTAEEIAQKESEEQAWAEQQARQAPINEIQSIERSNPITHRALREFFLGFGEVNPAFKATLLYIRVKAADDAIKVGRAKL